MNRFDTLIIGAGAAGMMTAIFASEKGKKVALLEHNKVPGRKILISGGGRCNFTNIHANPSDYLSKNKHFCKSAMSSYSPQDFVKFVEKHNIQYYEKKLGQLFCKKSAKDIIKALELEMKKNQVSTFYNAINLEVTRKGELYIIRNDNLEFSTVNLVIATGGLAVSQIGASDFGIKIAKQFGHKLIETMPALVPYKYSTFSSLSGISVVGKITTKKHTITEDILFTHKGFSGPAILKSSLHWEPKDQIRINWTPDLDVKNLFERKTKLTIFNALKDHLPNRFIEEFLPLLKIDYKKKIADTSKKDVNRIIENLINFCVVPDGTEGYRKAEAMKGGVDTKMVSSQTMESTVSPGLFFVGEVLDVTGQLGGFNFQWAWASGYVCGKYIQ